MPWQRRSPDCRTAGSHATQRSGTLDAIEGVKDLDCVSGGVVGGVADALRGGLFGYGGPQLVGTSGGQSEQRVADEGVADDLLIGGAGSRLADDAVHLGAVDSGRSFDGTDGVQVRVSAGSGVRERSADLGQGEGEVG